MEKRRLGTLAWDPKSTVFRRDDGSLWIRYRREYIALVFPGQFKDSWVMTNRHERINPDELVEVVDE